MVGVSRPVLGGSQITQAGTCRQSYSFAENISTKREIFLTERFALFSIFLTVTGVTDSATATTASRQTISLDTGWRFARQDNPGSTCRGRATRSFAMSSGRMVACVATSDFSGTATTSRSWNTLLVGSLPGATGSTTSPACTGPLGRRRPAGRLAAPALGASRRRVDAVLVAPCR